MNLDKKRILWIDGLRGIACLCIFFHHWLSAFFYAAIVGEIQYVHTSNLMDMKFSRSPLSFWANGNFMVCIFCMVTGLVLTLQIMQVDHKHTAKVLIKRYFRLALPLFVVSAVVYLMLKYSLFHNAEAAGLSASDWLGKYYTTPVSWKVLLKESFVTTWLFGRDTFSTAFWMMNLMFFGSYLVYAFGIAAKINKWAGVILAVLASLVMVYMHQLLMLNFCIGFLIALVMAKSKKKISNILVIPGIVLIIAGAWFGGFPAYAVPDGKYMWLTLTLGNYGISLQTVEHGMHIIGATLFMIGLALSKPLQNILESKVCIFMGRISYGVYLIHIPVLFSFGCWFFLLIFGYTGNYQLTSVIAFVVTMAVIILLAWAFNSLVEKNIGKILKKIFG